MKIMALININKVTIMKKIILIIITILLISSCANQKKDIVCNTTDKHIDSTWKVVKITEKANEIIFKLEYEIINKTDKTQWFYDMEIGNNWQSSAIHVLETVFIKKHEIVDMYDSEWSSTGPYSSNTPLCHEILPNDVLKGQIDITFIKRDGVSIYSTNFFILDTNISDISSKNELRKLLPNNIHEYWIYFDLLESTDYITDTINISNLVMMSEYVISYYNFNNIDSYINENFELHIIGNTGLLNYNNPPYCYTDSVDIQKFYEELIEMYGFITKRERKKVRYIPCTNEKLKVDQYSFIEEVEFFYGNIIAKHTFFIVKQGDEYCLERVIVEFIQENNT